VHLCESSKISYTERTIFLRDLKFCWIQIYPYSTEILQQYFFARYLIVFKVFTGTYFKSAERFPGCLRVLIHGLMPTWTLQFTSSGREATWYYLYPGNLSAFFCKITTLQRCSNILQRYCNVVILQKNIAAIMP